MKINPDEKSLLDHDRNLSNPEGSRRDIGLNDQGIEMTQIRQNMQSKIYKRTATKQTDTKIKNFLRDFVEGKFVTIVMTLVTVYALVGDDIRLWATSKNADPYFYSGLILSFFLFGLELILNTVVIDEFKYSFFFWLDIIATLSLIPDIPWITDILGLLVGSQPSYLEVNVIHGEEFEETIG